MKIGTSPARQGKALGQQAFQRDAFAAGIGQQRDAARRGEIGAEGAFQLVQRFQRRHRLQREAQARAARIDDPAGRGIFGRVGDFQNVFAGAEVGGEKREARFHGPGLGPDDDRLAAIDGNADTAVGAVAGRPGGELQPGFRTHRPGRQGEADMRGGLRGRQHEGVAAALEIRKGPVLRVDAFGNGLSRAGLFLYRGRQHARHTHRPCQNGSRDYTYDHETLPHPFTDY